MNLWSNTFIFACFLHLVLCEDLYQMLGVEKDADNREIRKAFKKLALKMHPDKNIDDADAHDKFVKLNRAYEVLKDEELRKKYDQYGEQGLADDFKGNKYESWKFYQQNFGIYDEDAEIITLSKADFEQSVENTQDIWFVNYYSAHCSHCHELAPTWREVAQELEGVVRIGAVNCEDDWMLCRQQGIRSYPSLVIYPRREKYQGTRSKSSMIEFALNELKVREQVLTDRNFQTIMTSSLRPWLISYCAGYGEDCLDSTAYLKLAAILEGLVSVGSVDCSQYMGLCQSLGVHSSRLVYYSSPPSAGEKDKALTIETLDPKEIATRILHQLPETTELNGQQFEQLSTSLKNGEGLPWLLHFTNGETTQIELKKLPPLLANVINVGKIDCRSGHPACSQLKVHKYPTFVLFKLGGLYEFHYGRNTAQDVAAFARESSATPVEALCPADFPDRVQFSGELWLVDFFAPWCPPCMRLLPEFRKASRMVDIGVKVNFGTVDCTVHSGLCEKLSINSYPTTLLYNNSKPNKFQGNHDASSIINFIKDVLDPPVIELSGSDFELNVAGKSSKEMWFVDFYTPWCPPCMQMMGEWRAFAKMLKHKAEVRVASFDCQAYSHICSQQGIASYPTMRMYPIGNIGTSRHLEFQGWYRNSQNFMAWAQDYLPSKVKVLNAHTFENEVLRSRESWVVDFYASWCGPCQQFAPRFETVAEMYNGRINFGKIDCEQFKAFCSNAYIQAYPTLRLYRGATNSKPVQNVFGEELKYNGEESILIQQLDEKLPRRQKARDEL